MDQPKQFLTTPVAILLGCFVIAVSILVSGGIIKVGSRSVGTKAADAQQPAVSAQPAASPQQAPQPPKATLAQVKDALSKAQIKFGDADKKLIVVEVADPSCPYCSVAAGENPELNKQVGTQFTLVADGGSYIAPVPEIKKLVTDGKAAFAYIYTPGHGNGEMGTKALYCANEKGKFWEAHDLIMNANGFDLLNNKVKNDKTKSQDVADFLQSAVDLSFMKDCLDSGRYDSRLKDDVALAQGIGISGTPGFYLNEKLFAGAYNYKDMEPIAKTALGI